MKTNLQDYTIEDLNNRLSELRKELMITRTVGSKDDSKYKSRNIRKEIARTLTKLRNRK